jgi:hypothetical protein
MKINKKLYIAVLASALMLPLGCSKDFLEKQDVTDISGTALFKKPDDAVKLVNACYNTFLNVDFMLKSLWYQANFLSQDFKNYGSDTFFERYEVPSSFDPLNTFWVRCYAGIARTNSAFPIIAQMKADGILDEALANRLTGEAYFLRGVFYYYLATNFGGVPLELKTVTDNGLHPRNTQDEVFTSVVSDMKLAANLLPWKEDYAAADLGRATKGAALAYLGGAQMWLKKYPDALTSFNQLEGKYQLMENFVDIHEFSKQNNKESVFEVQFLAYGDQAWGHANETHWLSSFGMPEEVTTFGYAYADKKLYDSFESGDNRKLATVIGPGDVHPSPAIKISSYPNVVAGFAAKDPRYIGTDGNIINTCGTVAKPWKGADGARSGYYGTKFWRDPSITGATGTPQNIFSGQNVIMMRYAEVLISKAEAQFRTGDVAGAMATIQIVRNRAFGKLTNSAAVVPPPPSGTNALNVILDEYRHELTGEMSLWFDLRRSGSHVAFVQRTYGIAIPPGKDIMPIPQSVLASNSTLVQNPSY